MGPKVQGGEVVCCKNSVGIRGEDQILQGFNGASNLPFLHGSGFPVLQTLFNLLEVTGKKVQRDKEEHTYNSIENVPTEQGVSALQLMHEGEVDTLLTNDKKRPTLKDLLEQSGKDEASLVTGSQEAERQEGKDHSVLEQQVQTSKSARSTGVGIHQDHVVVAVNKDQSSKDALIWALSHLIPPAAAITLLHVRPHARNTSGLRHLSGDAKEIVQEHQRICTGNKVKSEILIVEGGGVAKTLVEQINRIRITQLVLGTSPRNLITRKLKGLHIPVYVAKHSPPFCKVMVVSKSRLISVKEAQCLSSEASYPHFEVSLNLPLKSHSNKQKFHQSKDELADELSLADMVSSVTQNFAVGFGSEVTFAPGQGFGCCIMQRTHPSNGRQERSSSVPTMAPLCLDNTRGQLGELDAHTEDYSFSFSRVHDKNISSYPHEKGKNLKQRISSELSGDPLRNLFLTCGCNISEPSSPSCSTEEKVPVTWNMRLNSGPGAMESFQLDRPINTTSEVLGYKSIPTSPRARNLSSDAMKVVEINKCKSFEFKDSEDEETSFMGFKFEEASCVEQSSSVTLLESPIFLDELENLRVELEQARKDAEVNALRRKEAEEAAVKARCKAEEFAEKQEEEAKMKEEALRIAEAATLHATEEARKCSEALELAKAAQQALEKEMQLRKKAEEKAKQEAEAKQAVLAALQQSQFPYRDYDYEELRFACDNFAEARKLGEDGYGVVYEGKLQHTTVATNFSM